ncbi:ATP-dependent RNA helicase DbpA [Alteromonas lipolytica]|uniref:ATP-dependent RNA helicase DbpA n=1 Tax=Alteromonas lipolytica TaxID=1856405 RepID=A0A1E8F8W7_9ALTE|nr:ATP-dependent RNA helicase DbpA [Alteromonas lipolytica]OFI32357.1 ATP-dependent RNA helicase DbpA [Alteromonas lipolytica]GGF86400.1 ATP-dependent RNA helicase [Alteromonas lipolytica]
MTQSFSEFGLRPELLSAIDKAGFSAPRPVQAATLPAVLAGKDVLGQAQTGSGKTLAFAAGCLQALDVSLNAVQAMILCPTRELAEQVAEQCRLLARDMSNVKVLTLCGGQPMGPQISSLKHGCHIIVGTPGRVMDHVQHRRIDLRELTVRVFDEADRMLDMGFADDLAIIFGGLQRPVQSLFFSATFTPATTELAQDFLHEPETIEVDSAQRANVSELVYTIDDDQRFNALKALLTTEQPESAMVFCRTKRTTQDVADMLAAEGFVVAAIQGDMEQADRNRVLMRFASDCLNVLVATDVAARGLDIAGVDCVINYEVSENPDAHIHRIGRAGRAQKPGVAYTLMSERESALLAAIEIHTKQDFKKKGAQSLRFHANRIVEPDYVCLSLNAGKKSKLRPGDILGALTKDADVPGEDIEKIKVQANESFVAVKLRSVKRALKLFREGKIKGKRVRAFKL